MSLFLLSIPICDNGDLCLGLLFCDCNLFEPGELCVSTRSFSSGLIKSVDFQSDFQLGSNFDDISDCFLSCLSAFLPAS